MKHSQEEKTTFTAQCALQMAAEPTEGELALYAIVESLGFKRQQVIVGFTKNGGSWFYVADAYHEGLKLICEVDGSAHRNRKGRDRRRDTRLADEGIRTVRFTNKEVLKNPSAVLNKIKTWAELSA